MRNYAQEEIQRSLIFIRFDLKNLKSFLPVRGDPYFKEKNAPFLWAVYVNGVQVGKWMQIGFGSEKAEAEAVRIRD